MLLQYSMENVLLGVSYDLLHNFCTVIKCSLPTSGFTITCPGNPGHGSRFIENTAVEKVVSGLACVGVYYTKLMMIVHMQKFMHSTKS